MGEYQYVRFTVKDHIGIVTINHPPVNAINEDIRVPLAEIFESLNRRTDVYCVILQAEGKGFSGGHDLNEAKARLLDPDLRVRVLKTLTRSTNAIYHCRVPVIAAVHGYVVGVGFAYASLCDIIIAADNTSFKFPEIKVGTVGGPFWLKRIIPDKVARYHFYTGSPLSAAEMEHYGAVHKTVPKEQLFDAAMEVAKEIAQMYPPSVWASKMVITEGEMEVYDVVDVSDRMRYRGNEEILGNDPNKQEMVRAQMEHRRPVYDLSFCEKK